MKKALQPKSGIIYRGPSLIDGEPIVCIAIATKTNSKTGTALQTYILREDIDPMSAIRSGDDASVCGDCLHRGNGDGYKSRSCYINIGQAPAAIYRAYQRGIYPMLWNDVQAIRTIGAQRFVRLGSYGDPAAVPLYVWVHLLAHADGHTGYTHQWNKPKYSGLKHICMASIDKPTDYVIARSAGWRTFRVRTESEPTLPREVVCPASAESSASVKVQCSQCRACNGNATNRKGHVTVVAHGPMSRRFEANREV